MGIEKELKGLEERIKKSETYIKFVDFVKKHFAVLSKFIAEKIEEFKKDPTVIAIESKLKAIRAYLMNRIEAMKKELPAAIKQIEKFGKDTFKKSEDFFRKEITKLEGELKELVEKVKKSDAYNELKKNVEELEKFIKEIIGELLDSLNLRKITENV